MWSCDYKRVAITRYKFVIMRNNCNCKVQNRNRKSQLWDFECKIKIMRNIVNNMFYLFNKVRNGLSYKIASITVKAWKRQEFTYFFSF